MTVASALTALNTDIQNARTAITTKGGTVTSGGGSSQLATDIATIPTGSSPVITSLNVTPTTSEQTITAPSGTDGYSPINIAAVTSNIDANIIAENIKKDVQILGVTGSYEGNGVCVDCLPLGGSIGGNLVKASGTTSITSSIRIFKSNAGRIQNAVISDYFKGYKGLQAIDMPYLYTIDVADSVLKEAFMDCINLESVNLPELIEIHVSNACYQIFRNTKLTTLNLPKLTTITGTSAMEGCCRDCSSLISVNLPELTTLGNYCLSSGFNGCSNLTSVSMPKLNSLGNSALRYCFANTNVSSLSFPALKTTSFGSYTNQFQYMMSGVTNCTIHFPSNLQSTISGLTDYPTFGGTNITLAFDLAATS